MTDDPSTNSDEWVWRCKYAASGFACSSVLDRHSILCGLTLATPSPVLDSERPASDLIERLTEMVRLIDWRGSEARLRNLLTEAVIALEAADAHRCPTPERDDLAELRAAPGRPDSIQFRLRQFTPHHPVASGRQAMLDAADALDVARYADGTTPQAPTVDRDKLEIDIEDLLIDHCGMGGTSALTDRILALVDAARLTAPAPTVDSVPEADDVLLSLADDVAEVTEARRIYGRNFGAMGTPGSFVGPMPSERYELALAKILSAVRSHLAAAGVSSDR